LSSYINSPSLEKTIVMVVLYFFHPAGIRRLIKDNMIRVTKKARIESEEN
jgi:hypothetical protein